MRRYFICLIVMLAAVLRMPAQVQRLALEDAYELLEEQYPALQKSELLERQYQQSLASIEKDRLPELYLKGDSRLQSENLKITGEPGAPVPFEFELPLFSAKGYLEIQYNILNGKANDTKQALEAIQLRADMQNIEVDRYGLHSRINNIFTNITLLREQYKLLTISVDDLESKLDIVNAGVDNGVALPAESDKIRVKLLEVRSLQADINSRIVGLVGTLEQLTGMSISVDVVLDFPDLGPPHDIPELTRPELELFGLQKESILSRAALVDIERRPYLSVFAQGGAGYPNPVNFFDTDFAPYGIVGVNFAWKITDWNKNNTQKELLKLQAEQIDHARETFEFNLSTTEANYLAEVDRLLAQLETDEAIADLQANILDQMSVQLEEGVITTADYIVQFNAELKARQTLVLNRIKLLQTQLDFWNSRGTL